MGTIVLEPDQKEEAVEVPPARSRTQQFKEEADRALKMLSRLVGEVAQARVAANPYAVQAEMDWALRHGRLDLGQRLLELIGEHQNALASMVMEMKREKGKEYVRFVRDSEDFAPVPGFTDVMPDYLAEK